MIASAIRASILTALAALVASAPSAAAEAPCPSLLNHRFPNLREEPVSLCQFSGKALLIVNNDPADDGRNKRLIS